MNILAIDHGSKRLGLAWVDTSLGVVLPFGLIESTLLKEKVARLAEVLHQEKLDKIIVGFPLDHKGAENANTERVKKFVFELQKSIKIPVEFFDERFSSKAADALGEGVSRDERAAMIILQGYLEKEKSGKK